MSEKLVEEIMGGATAQGANGMPQLASAKNPQNLQRSLVAAFGHPVGAPQFTWERIPTAQGMMLHPFLLPHLWFQSLHANHYARWVSSVRGSLGAAASFWNNMKDTAFVGKHPTLRPNDWEYSIPLGLHGDGGAFSHSDGMFVFSFNSLINRTTTRSSRLVLTVVRKSLIAPSTLDAIAKILSWSFNALLSGIDPEVDWEERPLLHCTSSYVAGGYRGVLTQVRGDWGLYASVFLVPCWNAVARMCWLCLAVGDNMSPLRCTACSDTAPWRPTRTTHEQYMRVTEIIAAWFKYCLGLRIECIMIDVLHTVDLGIAAHIIGNIFWDCVVLKVWGGSTQESNVQALKTAMDAFDKKHNTKSRLQGKFTAERIRTSKRWPKLKGKGAATRHAAPFALHLAKLYLDRPRQLICEMLVRFYDILNEEDQFLSAGAKAELPILGRRLCELYSKLARDAVDANEKRWKTSPTFHLFLHLCEWQALEAGNPKYYWAYADEDLVGQIIDIAEACHPGTMALTTMVRWLSVVFTEALEE